MAIDYNSLIINIIIMDLLNANGVKKKQELLLQYLKKITNKAAPDDCQQQLRKFQVEVEQKYRLARHNHTYRFPREGNDSNDSSLEDLRDVTVCDLKSQ